MKINFSSLKVYVNTEIQKLHNVFSPILHSHGNITSNGMIGDSNNNANKNVVTDANGQITIEDKSEGGESGFNFGYVDDNLKCHLIKILDFDVSWGSLNQSLYGYPVHCFGDININEQTNSPIPIDVYINNNYLKTIYTSDYFYSNSSFEGYQTNFSFNIEGDEFPDTGENTIKLKCGEFSSEYTITIIPSVKIILNGTENRDSRTQILDVTGDFRTKYPSLNPMSGPDLCIINEDNKWVLTLPLDEYKTARFTYGVYMNWMETKYLWSLPDSDGEDIIVNFNDLPSQSQDSIVDSITLTSDKDILSYANNDIATLTATLTKNNNGISGKTITFKNGNTVLDTVQTDSNGEATYEYTSQGAGDVTITVECMNLQETYTIEDCHYYNSTNYTFTTDTSIPLNVPLPSTFKLEYDGVPTARNYSAPYLDVGRDSNDRILIGQYAQAGTNGIIIYMGGQTNKPLPNVSTLNEINHYTFTYDGADYTISRDNDSLNVTGMGVHLDKIIHIESGRGGSLANIKVKPL